MPYICPSVFQLVYRDFCPRPRRTGQIPCRAATVSPPVFYSEHVIGPIEVSYACKVIISFNLHNLCIFNDFDFPLQGHHFLCLGTDLFAFNSCSYHHLSNFSDNLSLASRFLRLNYVLTFVKTSGFNHFTHIPCSHLGHQGSHGSTALLNIPHGILIIGNDLTKFPNLPDHVLYY